MTSRLTIKDIARISGVGISTVSRVVNNRPDVSEETRQRVLDVVNHQGYVPNSNAKHLKQRNSDYIGVIVRGTRNMFLAGLLEQLQHCIEKTDYHFLPWYIDEHGDEIQAAQNLYSERKVQGIVFLGGSAQGREADLANFPVPCVFATADASCVPSENIMSVSLDDRAGGRAAMDYLFSCGHTRIAVVGGALETKNLIGLRYQGVLDSCSAHGEAFDAAMYLTSAFSLSTAYQAMLDALKNGLDCTAVFAMSDVMAIGVAKAITDMGLSIPGDVSVIGYDGIELGAYLTPTLATIRQPIDRIATECMRLITGSIENCRDLSIRHVSLSGELIHGQSVQKLY